MKRRDRRRVEGNKIMVVLSCILKGQSVVAMCIVGLTNEMNVPIDY